MKLSKTITLAVAMLLIASMGVFAGEEKKDAKAETPKELKNQTHCPVMGGVIDSASYTDIQGQRVYHCCAGCTKQLEENPDKYFKKAAADGILFENVQANCPVSGKALENKDSFIDHEGRRVAFCCDGCIATFKKEPAKYLAILDAPVKETKKTEMKATGHEGHNH